MASVLEDDEGTSAHQCKLVFNVFCY